MTEETCGHGGQQFQRAEGSQPSFGGGTDKYPGLRTVSSRGTTEREGRSRRHFQPQLILKERNRACIAAINHHADGRVQIRPL